MPTALRPFFAALAGALTAGFVAFLAKHFGFVVAQDQQDAIKAGVEVFLVIAITFAGQHLGKFFLGVKSLVEKPGVGPVVTPKTKAPPSPPVP